MTGIIESHDLVVLNSGMPRVIASLDAAALFERYHDRIYRYVLRMVKNPAEAEDLTQDTFLRAYDRQDTLRDPLAARGWLYQIATHLCLDRLRQGKPQLSMDSQEGVAQVAAIASGSPTCLEITERKETSSCVQRCLDFLPDKYRAVILLHEGHSLTASEIAELLGVTVTTVKIRLHRARRKLKKIMDYGCAVSKDSKGVPVCQPKSKVA